jgi:hypothetical protein
MTTNSLTPEQQIKVMARDVDRLLKLVDGDASMGIVGLRERQEKFDAFQEKLERRLLILYGILIGVGVADIGTLVTVLAKLGSLP